MHLRFPHNGILYISPQKSRCYINNSFLWCKNYSCPVSLVFQCILFNSIRNSVCCKPILHSSSFATIQDLINPINICFTLYQWISTSPFVKLVNLIDIQMHFTEKVLHAQRSQKIVKNVPPSLTENRILKLISCFNMQ